MCPLCSPIGNSNTNCCINHLKINEIQRVILCLTVLYGFLQRFTFPHTIATCFYNDHSTICLYEILLSQKRPLNLYFKIHLYKSKKKTTIMHEFKLLCEFRSILIWPYALEIKIQMKKNIIPIQTDDYTYSLYNLKRNASRAPSP